MTPLQIEILVWYISHAADYLDGDFRAPAVREAITEFRDVSKMLGLGDNGYQLTDRGIAYTNALINTPLPVIKWVFPAGSDGEDAK